MAVFRVNIDNPLFYLKNREIESLILIPNKGFSLENQFGYQKKTICLLK